MTDETAFAAQLEPHRRELQVHCYRMLGSFDEAEDLVQETFLRAWRKRASYEGRATLRAWLYKIATNACLDLIARNKRRVAQSAASANPSEVPWLEPIPDLVLDELPSHDPDPETAIVARETIELAYLVAIQHLPPRQRAALILRDVLGWSAKETAELLETSVASANSALQRARAGLEHSLPANRAASASSAERALLARFMDAHERADASGIADMLREDVRVTMPPLPDVYEGIAALRPLWEHAFDESVFGEWRLVATRVNRMPAAASYLRRQGETGFRAFKLDVLRVEGDRIAEITTFGAQPFARLGLAATLESSATTSIAMFHGSRTSRPSGRSSEGAPAAITRSRSAAAPAAGSTIVQCRSPTTASGVGGMPRPRQMLRPR